MQFNTFKNIIAIYKPELEVYSHGSFSGEHRTDIIYPNNKIYSYSGTYTSILYKLGIKFITQSDIDLAKNSLNHYTEMNGSTTNLFAKLSKKPYDCSDKILYWENVLKTYATLPFLDEKAHTLSDNGQIFSI